MPSPQLDHAKQGKHVPGHRNFILGRSLLTDADPQALLDAFAGAGVPVNAVPLGVPGSKERVDFGKIIGQYVDPISGQMQPTRNGIIVYDRRGRAHIIPARP